MDSIPWVRCASGNVYINTGWSTSHCHIYMFAQSEYQGVKTGLQSLIVKPACFAQSVSDRVNISSWDSV